MRKITNITISEETNTIAVGVYNRHFAVYLTYNGDDTDYSFSTYCNLGDALKSIPNNDPYFPIELTSEINLWVMDSKGNIIKTHLKF